jgi:hypothetical protein
MAAVGPTLAGRTFGDQTGTYHRRLPAPRRAYFAAHGISCIVIETRIAIHDLHARGNLMISDDGAVVPLVPA